MSSSYLRKSVIGDTQTNSAAIQADYVILFDASHSQAVKAYGALYAALEQQDLQVTSRPGAKHSKQILLFVRAKQANVHKALQAERVNDWLQGIHSTRPDPREQRDFNTEPMTQSERLRVVYDLITGADSASIVIGSSPYEPVTAIFPPHDPHFNAKWLKSWTSLNKDTLVAIPDEQLNNIKNHFGEAIALYFEFLRFYFSSLLVPACIGFVTWASLGTYSIIYSVIVIAWSMLLVEGWRIRERVLAVRWGTYKVSAIGKLRPQFQGTMKAEDKINGGYKAIFPWYLRDLRVLSSIPVLLAFASGLVMLIALIFTSEVLINEVYDGKGKSFFSLLPTIGFAGVVPQVVSLWHQTAVKLTNYENHKRDPAYERSLILKMFSLNAIVAFGTLSLTAYVYIPFGSLLVPDILNFLRRSQTVPDKLSPNQAASTFNINAERLTNTLFALSTTTQAIGFFSEVIVPFATRIISAKVNDRREEKGEKRSTDAEGDDPKEKEFLERIRKEASLPEYNTFLDYAEMVQQFGYVCLWSVAWPLCPVAALVNNFFELRGDAFKVCVNNRRTAPKRVESIGPWLDTLAALTWVAALTNSSLIYMFQSRTADAIPIYSRFAHTIANTVNATAEALNMPDLPSSQVHPFHTTRIHQATVAPGSTYTNVRTALFTAILVGLASERLFQAFRAATKHCLEHIFWVGTKEEAALKRREVALKNQYVSALGLSKEPQISEEKQNFGEETYGAGETFWSRGDLGSGLLKTKEVKKAQ